jgi:multidrug efflux pump subunit AcrA (membrane-fusion protein)
LQLKQKYTAVCRVAEDRANLIASMKGKYNEMFERKKNILDKKAMREALSRNKIKEIADQNPSYAAYYKKKLVASEERVRDLTKMLKSFMMSDHKKKTALTSTRKIAERYQLELDSVKQQLQSSEQTRNRVEQRILNMELQQRRRRRPQSAGVRRNSKINPIINRLQSENSELSASSSIAPADAMLSELREELKQEQKQMLKGGNAQSMPIISTTSIISETSQYEVPITFASNSLKK